MSDLEQQLATLQATAQDAISQAQTLEALEQLRVDYLGKKGEVSKILGGMGKLPAEERPAIGAAANVVKDAIQAQLDRSKTDLQAAQIQAQLAAETLDVTMPGGYRSQGRIHPINATIDRMIDIFVGISL